MTRRATLRGAERTPLDERADVLICGASFAGLAVARELFASADAAVEAAPASVRPGIRLACAIYLGVLDRVEAIGYDVLGRRPRLPAWQLPLVAIAALRR